MLRFLCVYENVTGAVNRMLNKAPVRATLLFAVALVVGAFVSTRWIDGNALLQNIISSHQRTTNPFVCPGNQTIHTCSAHTPSSTVNSTVNSSNNVKSPSCPDYFRWIHDDLRPWNATGITREMVESARPTANFRLVILNGRAYVETFSKAFQTRDVFTLWGILQLLRRYPGRVPDLELLFDCNDPPVIRSRDHVGKPPPALFAYCADDETLDIVFPDWSFWGWPEVHIKSWEPFMKELKQGNERMKWKDREPYAFWKGNPWVSGGRQDLLKCSPSKSHDWNARLFKQDWDKASRRGYKQSNLASQCTYRYKIYIEGRAWSVSEKYILACNSPALFVKNRYHDFFTRGLMPMQHYWPIRDKNMCKSIKFAVDWGNSHQQEAQAIGKAGSSFTREELKMDYVYDYMFHLLNEYAKLLRFKPTKPERAVEVCLESMGCPAEGLVKEYMEESMVKGPSESGPCSLPPAFDQSTLQELLRKKQNFTKQVEIWESQNKV